MEFVRFKNITLAILILLAINLLLPDESFSQKIAFLNVARPAATDNGLPSEINQTDIRIGDVIEIDIWCDVKSNNVSSIAIYMTYDPNVFEIIDQNSGVEAIVPFDLEPPVGAFGQENANIVEKIDAVFGANIYSAGSFGGSQETITGLFRYGRIALRAINIAENSEITIDFNQSLIRMSGMYDLGSNFDPFNQLESLNVHVMGVNVADVPDILMNPGQTLTDTLTLNDFLLNPPDDLSTLSWKVDGVQDSIQVTIDPLTQVTVTADAAFTGIRQFIFTVTNEYNVSDADTMLVSVSFNPEIKEESFPNPIIFNEDKTFSGFLLDTLVTDPDDPGSAIIWSAYSLNEDIFVDVDNSSARTFTVSATNNYSGSGVVVFRATDAKSLFDTLQVNVQILEVNDPPVISGLPNIHILPNDTDKTIVLWDYTSDIDTPVSNMHYNWTGNTNVEIREQAGSQLYIFAKAGFEGFEEIVFNAWDDDFATASSDTIIVTVGPKPPVIVSLPDTIIKAESFQTTIPYLDLDDYVTDDDNPLSSLSWQGSGSELNVIIDTDHLASFVVPANMHGYDEVVFQVEDPAGATAVDTITVLVLLEGRPLIFDLPDIYYIRNGSSEIPFDLDTVVVDSDTDPEDMTWSVVGNDKINVTIDPDTHLLTISSLDPQNFTKETVQFQVKDVQGNVDIHVMDIQPISFGTPVLTEIPDVEISRNKSAQLNLDNYLFFFPDSDRTKIRWSVVPSIDEDIKVELDQFTGYVEFSLLNSAFLGAKSFTFTATNSANGEKSSDVMIVDVNWGKEPIIGSLPNIVFASGDTSAPILLDKYLFDEDTPADSIFFTVSSDNIIPLTETLAKGGEHKLILTSKPNFVGPENIIVTAVDPEGNSDSDTLLVKVTTSATLDLVVVPNPTAVEFIDIIIFASDSIFGSPTISIKIDNNVSTVDPVKLPDQLIWKGDYVFQSADMGDVTILAEADDSFGGSISDSVVFTLGQLSKNSDFRFSDNNLQLNISSNGIINEEKIMIMPDDPGELASIYDRQDIFGRHIGVPLKSYYIGPENSGVVEGSMEFNLNTIHTEKNLDKIGLYRYDSENKEIQFVTNYFEQDKTAVKAQFTKFGRYFIALDEISPTIRSAEVVDRNKNIIEIDIEEEGSGIQKIKVYTKSKTYDKQVDITEERKYRIQLSDQNLNDIQEIRLNAVDRSGNTSNFYTLEYKSKNQLPEKYSLSQNYPNPFNPVTNITYNIPSSERVIIKIFNVKGQLVRTLVDSFMDAGAHSAVWDGKDMSGNQVSSGTYIYTLVTNNYRKAMKMILLK